MFIGRLRVVGLLFLLTGALAGCSGDELKTTERTDVAVRAYAVPHGAPGYCASLAGSTHLAQVPAAIGTLVARSGDVEAKLTLAAAVDDLRAVRAELTTDTAPAALETALDDLVAALDQAEDGALTDTARAAIATGLDDVGRIVQPICDFPT